MWSFIVDNGPLFSMFGVVASVLVVGLFLVPLLKRNGLIKQDDARLTAQILEVVALLASDMRFKDEKTQKDATTIMQIARTATQYVVDMMGDASDIAKRDYAFTAAVGTLEQLGIEVTDARKKLIEITVAIAFQQATQVKAPK